MSLSASTLGAFDCIGEGFAAVDPTVASLLAALGLIASLPKMASLIASLPNTASLIASLDSPALAIATKSSTLRLCMSEVLSMASLGAAYNTGALLMLSVNSNTDRIAFELFI